MVVDDFISWKKSTLVCLAIAGAFILSIFMIYGILFLIFEMMG